MYKKENLIKIIILSLIILPAFIFADGFIVIPPPHPRPPYPTPYHPEPFPLEVVYHHVEVDIDGQMATTHIDQSFYNPTNRQLEGYYLFPVPKGAVLKDFTIFINGKETPAELLDAKKAREIYEDIVRKMKDPALLEYNELGLFKVRIYPIEPHSEKKVTMSYREVLHEDNGTFEYIYPLNTEKFSSKPLKDVSVKIELKSKDKIKNIYCPTHEVDIIRHDENHSIISYEEMNVTPDTDFKLYYDTNASKVGLSLLSYRKPNEDGYFFLSATPAIKFDENDINEKDITFVLDVSGSMAGNKLKQAKRALIYCIENLNYGDRFELIRFSTEAYALFKELVPANKQNIEKAEEFIEKMRPVGGTNIEEALNMALKLESKPDRPYMIIFITDGKPTIGEMDKDKLVEKIRSANLNNTRIFTFGIGNEINTHLLDKITEVTRSTRSYISPSEDIEIKISQFYDKVQSPVLTDVVFTYQDPIEVYQTYPGEIPNLFKGSNITIFGRYRNHGNIDIMLSGKLKGKTKEYKFPVYFNHNSEKNDFIPPIWASRRIGHLLDLIRLHGESKELIDEITELARTHGIVTPYTSYLIIEDEEVRTVRNEIRDEFQTLGRGNFIAPESKAHYKKEFEEMQLTTGGRSVQVSKEFYGLNNAFNVAQTRQGKDRMSYKTSEGTISNLIQQVKNIQGRAVYQSGKFWVDSQLQNEKPENTQRIQFASKEYFELLKEEPESGQFLALGQNVRFFLNNTFYEIYE